MKLYQFVVFWYVIWNKIEHVYGFHYESFPFLHHAYLILVQFPISIPPESIRKPLVFLDFSGSIKMEHSTKMGYIRLSPQFSSK